MLTLKWFHVDEFYLFTTILSPLKRLLVPGQKIESFFVVK